MSLSFDRTSLTRLNKDVADLRGKEAAEVKKAADAQKKINSANDAARRATSTSSAKSYLSTAERESKNLEKAQENQSRYSSQAATKIKDVARLQERIAKEEESERKKAQLADDNRRRDEISRQRRIDDATLVSSNAMQQRIADLEAQVAQQLEEAAVATPAFKPKPASGQAEVYDVFISHAWEDKSTFVDDLATKAKAAGIRVWYDTAVIEWGDSLRQKIDEGLAVSYFGVAVLSPHFFAKPWPNYELDGLMEKAASGTGRLLPIWHKLTKDEVAEKAPSLAGRMALNTSFMSTDDIVEELKRLRDRYRSNAIL